MSVEEAIESILAGNSLEEAVDSLTEWKRLRLKRKTWRTPRRINTKAFKQVRRKIRLRHQGRSQSFWRKPGRT